MRDCDVVLFQINSFRNDINLFIPPTADRKLSRRFSYKDVFGIEYHKKVDMTLKKEIVTDLSRSIFLFF